MMIRKGLKEALSEAHQEAYIVIVVCEKSKSKRKAIYEFLRNRENVTIDAIMSVKQPSHSNVFNTFGVHSLFPNCSYLYLTWTVLQTKGHNWRETSLEYR